MEERKLRELGEEVVRLKDEVAGLRQQHEQDIHHLDQHLADTQALLNRVMDHVGLHGWRFPERPIRGRR